MSKREGLLTPVGVVTDRDLVLEVLAVKRLHAEGAATSALRHLSAAVLADLPAHTSSSGQCRATGYLRISL